MQPQEKMAWYTLAVVFLAVATYLVLLFLTGDPAGSQAAFALIALCAFSGLFATGGKRKVLGDEHDREISLKATRTTFVIFWLYFVAYCMLILGKYSETVPRYTVSTLLWSGMCVFLGVQSIAILVYYRADSTERTTVLDWFRNMSNLRKMGLVSLGMSLFVMTPFAFVMTGGILGKFQEPLAPSFSYLICGSFAVVYLLIRFSIDRYFGNERELKALVKAKRIGDLTLGIALLGAALGLGAVSMLPTNFALAAKLPQTLFFILMAGILSLALGMIIFGRDEGEDIDSAVSGERAKS